MWRESGRIGHRHACPSQGSLKGAREVPVRSKPQPAALRVAQPDSLYHRRGRRSGRLAGRHR